MNLTNHGETLSVDSVAPFKLEPTDMMASYYQNASSDNMNQTDMAFPFLEEPTPWLDDTFNAFNNVSDGKFTKICILYMYNFFSSHLVEDTIFFFTDCLLW